MTSVPCNVTGWETSWIDAAYCGSRNGTATFDDLEGAGPIVTKSGGYEYAPDPHHLVIETHVSPSPKRKRRRTLEPAVIEQRRRLNAERLEREELARVERARIAEARGYAARLLADELSELSCTAGKALVARLAEQRMRETA
jgi:hypothetical protein